VDADADDGGPLRVPLLPLGELLLGLGTRAFGRRFAGTAVTRAGRHRLLRNVICALANASRDGVSESVRRFLERAELDGRLEVRAHAARALRAEQPSGLA